MGSPARPHPAPRRRRTFGVVALALAALTALGVCSGPEAVAAPAAPTSVDASPGVPGTGLQLGIQQFSMWRDWDTHQALMDRAVQSGTDWLRVDVGWCSLEEAGSGIVSAWYQDRLDAVVQAATARHLHLLLTLTCAPTWSTPGNIAGVYPGDPAEYGRVARYLASRYRGRVAAWEIWNEPDCMAGGCPNGSPAAYLPILQAGYGGVKQGDPAALVVNGGLSGINPGWIGQFLALGGGRYLDALAVHPYLAPEAAAPATPAVAGYTNPYRITNVPAARALMISYGLRNKPIWFTEFGWTTGRTPGSPYDGVSPATQARYLREAVDLVSRKYRYVTLAFWYTTRDRDDSSAFEDGFGVLTVDGTPKPAFAALTRANQALRAR